MDRSSARTLGMAVCVVVGSIVPAASVAVAQTPPPDDGAPPEEYRPSDEGVSFDLTPPGSTVTAQLTNDELPKEPPADNVFPIAGRTSTSCSNGFGEPRWPDRLHLGVDCFAPIGTPLVAAESGTIRYATPSGDPYNCSTGGGDASGHRVSVRGVSGYVYYYGHLDQILVESDANVMKGQVIGTIGRTGNASCSSPHLHFEVKCGENGPPFDPYPVLGGWRTAGAPDTAWPTNTEGNGVGFVFSGPARADLFALECGRAVRQRAWIARQGGLLPGWYEMPGEARSDPDAASPGEGGTPQIFFRGSDNATWQVYFNGSSWNTISLGGSCTSGPSTVYSGPGRVDVFCRGTDSALYLSTWIAGVGWYPWYRVGSVATSDPDAASAGPGTTPQVYFRGTDNAIHQGYWDGSSWQFINLGGRCTSGPSAVYSGPGRLDLYCRGLDLAIYHMAWRAESGWGGWSRINSLAISAPEASSQGPELPPQVFARGVDRRLDQFVWNGSSWSSYSWGLT